ncbi:MAG: hypothetical protein AAB853_04445, partial [Patescibacteria group bacterium]
STFLLLFAPHTFEALFPSILRFRCVPWSNGVMGTGTDLLSLKRREPHNGAPGKVNSDRGGSAAAASGSGCAGSGEEASPPPTPPGPTCRERELALSASSHSS